MTQYICLEDCCSTQPFVPQNEKQAHVEEDHDIMSFEEFRTEFDQIQRKIRDIDSKVLYNNIKDIQKQVDEMYNNLREKLAQMQEHYQNVRFIDIQDQSLKKNIKLFHQFRRLLIFKNIIDDQLKTFLEDLRYQQKRLFELTLYPIDSAIDRQEQGYLHIQDDILANQSEGTLMNIQLNQDQYDPAEECVQAIIDKQPQFEVDDYTKIYNQLTKRTKIEQKKYYDQEFNQYLQSLKPSQFISSVKQIAFDSLLSEENVQFISRNAEVIVDQEQKYIVTDQLFKLSGSSYLDIIIIPSSSKAEIKAGLICLTRWNNKNKQKYLSKSQLFSDEDKKQFLHLEDFRITSLQQLRLQISRRSIRYQTSKIISDSELQGFDEDDIFSFFLELQECRVIIEK